MVISSLANVHKVWKNKIRDKRWRLCLFFLSKGGWYNIYTWHFEKQRSKIFLGKHKSTKYHKLAFDSNKNGCCQMRQWGEGRNGQEHTQCQWPGRDLVCSHRLHHPMYLNILSETLSVLSMSTGQLGDAWSYSTAWVNHFIMYTHTYASHFTLYVQSTWSVWFNF